MWQSSTKFSTVLFLFLFLSSCASNGPLGRSGLPDERYLVGGGFSIEYRAPARGTAYVVEQGSGRILVTQALDTGEKFDFIVDPDELLQRPEMQRVLGVTNGVFKPALYFVPDPGRPSSAVSPVPERNAFGRLKPPGPSNTPPSPSR